MKIFYTIIIFLISLNSCVSDKINNSVIITADLIDPENPPIIDFEESENEVEVTHADIHKASSIIGYLPKTNIYEGMDKFFTWFDGK